MAFSGLRQRNSLAGSVWRRWRPGEFWGHRKRAGLRKGDVLSTGILLPSRRAAAFIWGSLRQLRPRRRHGSLYLSQSPPELLAAENTC